jgi:hypothetical protein
MDTPEIPADLSDPAAWHKEQAAEQRIAQEERQRLAELRRLEASLNSLRSNPDFAAWINDFFGKDVNNKLEQLRTCHADNLPLARQRWLDAEGMLTALRQILDQPAAG